MSALLAVPRTVGLAWRGKGFRILAIRSAAPTRPRLDLSLVLRPVGVRDPSGTLGPFGGVPVKRPGPTKIAQLLQCSLVVEHVWAHNSASNSFAPVSAPASPWSAAGIESNWNTACTVGTLRRDDDQDYAQWRSVGGAFQPTGLLSEGPRGAPADCRMPNALVTIRSCARRIEFANTRGSPQHRAAKAAEMPRSGHDETQEPIASSCEVGGRCVIQELAILPARLATTAFSAANVAARCDQKRDGTPGEGDKLAQRH